MRKRSKFLCALALTAALLAATVAAGCAQSTDYTEEIRGYQERLETLMQENEALQERLALLEGSAASPGIEEETQETAETQSDSGTAFSEETVEETEPAPETVPAETEGNADAGEEKTVRILVLGDSIWGNYRDDTGVAVKVQGYMGRLGYDAVIYNAAIGGTKATLDPEDSPWEFGPGSNNDLPKMISILDEKTDVGYLQGKAAYEEMAAAIEGKDKLDVVILAYGMNDFLEQAAINNSDEPWKGYGTALVHAVGEIRRICPKAQIMIVAPTYASYFPISVSNMGEKALSNYASIAMDVAKGEGTLCVDGYSGLGIDPYTADAYIEDGVHLNEKGRDVYARAVASCLVFGQEGQVSGNTYDFDRQN